MTGSEGISTPDDRPVDESEDTPDIELVEVERRRDDRRKGGRRKYNRRSSDSEAVEGDLAKTPSNKVLRVDQARIDTLMDLVGELVVAKNSLPFLAKRAEEDFGIRELAKEIKAQYAVINRLSDELQSAMMAVRMVPVSSVFQRFPRLVRDLSRKLGKDIRLVMEGEDTEADKNVIENLADPLIHLVRNSLDHGIEGPAERREAGKPEQGTLILRAIPKDDQVIIEIVDDGKGIDPNVIKQKAYEKGIIDEAQLESISDQEAIELIFAAGLSSKEDASDLSGRGVGMDVVRTAVAESGGSVSVSSELGKGSKLSLALPLSMAVTRVMMIEVADQTYGISMEVIRETVRVPSASIERIKQDEAIVLRNKLIPLRRMRKVLGLPSNAQPLDEEAVLIVSLAGQEIGLIIDEFQEGIDIIQKPLEGVMEAYPMYAGATLLGDGRVLLILDLKELVG
ncbi:MAG: chemotaxis protein CheA [Candidatus Thiodiazotropha sp.]